MVQGSNGSACGITLSWMSNKQLGFWFLHRRVPVSRLGSRGPGGGQKTLRLCSQSVRKRLQASASVARFWESKIVAKRRTVVTFGLALGLRVSKESTVTRIGGVAVAKTQNCRHFWTGVGSPRLKSLNSHRIGGLWSRNAELSSLLDSRWVFTSQKCQQSQGSGGVVVAKTQNCPHFWIGMGLHVSKVRTVRGIGGFEVAKRRTVDSHKDREGRGRQNAELSSLWICVLS